MATIRPLTWRARQTRNVNAVRAITLAQGGPEVSVFMFKFLFLK